MINYNIWFTADLHLGHKNILKHQIERIEKMGLVDSDDIIGHDNYIINMWKNITKRNDHIYVLGDFIMLNQQGCIRILNELKSNGCIIHLIVGNHDKSIKKMFNMFESIDEIKSVTFKKDNFDFIEQDFNVVLSHYPMKSWPNKCRGSMQLYGHVHANALWIDDTDDLCLNVGLDNPLCNYTLFSLKQVYEIYLKKLNGENPLRYSDVKTNTNKLYIR